MRGQLPRRVFIRGAAGTVAGTLLSACDNSTPSPEPAPPAPRSEPVDWTRLSNDVRGRVVLPSDAGYADAKVVFNARFAASAPAAVVVPASVDDVRRAMDFAAAQGVKVAPRSGGHSYVGASAAAGAMVVDLRPLARAFAYDGTRMATVPAATGLDPVQTTLAAHGRLIPSGTCPTVGVAGLTLGGGLGADTRSAGLTCDTVRSMSVVLPGGDAVTAGPDDHADLFWALRGGGGGNVGVVTSFSFDTFAAVDRDVVTMRFPEPAVADVIVQWQQWLATAERTIWGMVNIPVGADARGCTVVLATAAGAGPGRAAQLVKGIGTEPLSQNIRTLGRLNFVRYFAGGDGAREPRSFVAGSDVIGDLDAAAATAIVAATKAWPDGAAGGATAVIESLTGAVGDVTPDGSVFPWRRHAACIQWYTEPSTPNEIDVATTWLTDAHEAVRPHSVGGYVNYLEQNTAADRYFGDNLGRLATVRQRYDPTGVMVSGLTW